MTRLPRPDCAPPAPAGCATGRRPIPVAARALRLPSVLLAASLVLVLLGCDGGPSPPRVVDGRLDLADWSFESRGDVPLLGDWEICWGELLGPGEDCPSAWRNVPVRGLWTDPDAESPIGGRGVATYRLRIALPGSEARLSLLAGGALTAHRLFIDGADRGGVGVVGRSARDTRMGVRNRVHHLPRGTGEVELVVQVANFDFRSGGLRRIWYLGREESIRQGIGRAVLREGMVFSVGVVVGLGYLALFALGRSEQARGYFGLTALILGLRAVPASISDFGPLLAPWADFALSTRLEYLGTAITIFAGAGYVRTKVAGVVPPRTAKALQLAGLALAAITALAPFDLMLATLPLQYVLPVLVMGLCIFFYGRAWIRGVSGVRITAAASILYMCVIVHDIARTAWTDLGAPVELYPYAMVIWILAEASELMRRFHLTFSRIELLSDELREANFELQETESAIVRFVPFDFLRLLGKRSIRDVDAGDRARASMTVLRCGFSRPDTAGASTAPEADLDLVSEVVARAEPLIQRHGGFVNEFGGDGFEAFFSSGPEAAVAAALEIVGSRGRPGGEGDGGGSGDPGRQARPIGFTAGIDRGSVVLGTVGGREHIMRAVFGRPIEGARQLEREARRAGVGILVSAAVAEALGDAAAFELRPVESVPGHGPDAPARAFRVVPRAGAGRA